MANGLQRTWVYHHNSMCRIVPPKCSPPPPCIIFAVNHRHLLFKNPHVYSSYDNIICVLFIYTITRVPIHVYMVYVYHNQYNLYNRLRGFGSNIRYTISKYKLNTLWIFFTHNPIKLINYITCILQHNYVVTFFRNFHV